MCIAITYMCFAHGIVAVIVYETVGILFKVFGWEICPPAPHVSILVKSPPWKNVSGFMYSGVLLLRPLSGPIKGGLNSELVLINSVTQWNGSENKWTKFLLTLLCKSQS